MKMKRLYLLFTAMMLSCLPSIVSQAQAQTPDWLWAKSAGNNSYDYAQSLRVDSLGNSYVTGYFSLNISFDGGSTVLTSAGSSDMYIAKYDPSGNMVWSRRAGGSDGDMATGIAVDRAGNSYVVGYFKSASLVFGSTTLTNAGGNTYDLFLVKYDSDGNVVWAHSAGGIGDDRAQAVAVDTLGNVFVAGYFVSAAITVGNTTLTNTGALDMFILKADSDGDVQWAKSSSSTTSGWENAFGIAVDDDGNSFVTGDFNGTSATFGNVILSGGANSNVFVVKYSPTGTVVWANRAGVNSDNKAAAVAVDTAGNCYVTGYFKGSTIVFGATTLTNAGHADTYLVKYSPNGVPLWAKSAGGAQEDGGSALAVDRLGQVYYAGYYKSPSLTFGSNTLTNAASGTYDIFVIEYAPDGSIAWAKTAGGTGDDHVNTIAVDTLRNFFLAGYFGSPSLVFGTTTLTCAGSTDVFVTKSDNIALGVHEVTEGIRFTLFPNPATTSIQLTLSQKASVEIFDMQGRMCQSIQCNSTNSSIEVGNLPSGMYWVRATTEKGTGVQKMIKQ
jgi:hypothetical protein